MSTAWTCGPLVAALMMAGVDPGPAVVGQWAPPQEWPVIGIHAAMLPSGKVLHYSYPTSSQGSTARLWSPGTGLFTPANFPFSNIFCSGLSMLPNGFFYETGGTLPGCDFRGMSVTNAFNPFTESWTYIATMADGRWYPTNILLGDGSTIILSGRSLDCVLNTTMERYVPGGGIELVLGGQLQNQSLFPRLHLLTSGEIVRVGQEVQTIRFDPQAVGPWQVVGLSNFGHRCEGTSVLLPGRTDQILIVGGMCPATGTAEIIDFSAGIPQWRYTNPLNHPRGHADALILPDATVMVVGGGTQETYGMPVLIPELFDPDTETWTQLAPHTYGRMYHATTVLLPDGRVLVAGQDDGLSAFSGEIYSPPYLFAGPRPGIGAVPQRISYGRAFSLATANAAQIGSVALIAPTTVTHSVNTSQRYVGLDFEVLGAGGLRLTGPLNGNHAPPMYYMLFIVDDGGVPSVAEWVQVGDFPAGDVDGDGLVTVVDLLALLAGWGPCLGCNADFDGDGFVTVVDLLMLLANWSSIL